MTPERSRGLYSAVSTHRTRIVVGVVASVGMGALYWAAGRPAVTDAGLPTDPGALAAVEAPTKLDMAAIFPPGDGRDLVLNNCLACHGFVRIVLLQRTPEQWAYVRRLMRPQVPHLDDAQVDALFDYLQDHFNDGTPEPNLPDWFVDPYMW